MLAEYMKFYSIKNYIVINLFKIVTFIIVFYVGIATPLALFLHLISTNEISFTSIISLLVTLSWCIFLLAHTPRIIIISSMNRLRLFIISYIFQTIYVMSEEVFSIVEKLQFLSLLHVILFLPAYLVYHIIEPRANQ